jgi:hypothetical protein
VQENEIIPYLEMCQRERVSLQRGMNYRLGGNYSVILMSVRPNAPYRDRIEEDGTVLIYEGHDLPRNRDNIDPKLADQPQFLPSGKPTQNGLFYIAAHDYKKGSRQAERVRVYEKIRQGIWSYNGVFQLVDSWLEPDKNRDVFKFRLVAVDEDVDLPFQIEHESVRRRIIPSEVKMEVWKRDRGKCVICGANDELHFDHIIPFSKGGTSLSTDNVQLLCARHNIAKRDKIE